MNCGLDKVVLVSPMQFTSTNVFLVSPQVTIKPGKEGAFRCAIGVNNTISCGSRRSVSSRQVEVLLRQHFRRDLRAGRFTMEFAQSGPAALQRITDATGVSLILILSDINMPGMSGLELLPKAKALRPDVPVIMITAYGDAETKRKALEKGAEALLTKPIDFAILRNECRQRLPRAAPSRASR
jgi:CheY-like chemotaxis protein